jgi:hypothetical protein
MDTRKTVMWNLVHELLKAFCHSDDYNRYQNPLWSTTSPNQFTAAGITCLGNCFPDGILRIETIFLQDVISKQKGNKVGRRKLGVTRWKPNDQNSKKKKSSKITITLTSDQQIPIDSRNLVNQSEPPRKKQRQTRRETKPEEKKLLEPLITCPEYPTSNQLDQVKEALGDEWDKNRIYQYISRHRNNKK